MNLALLLPSALFALAALILPLLIHLSRRSEQRPTDFAALRWLSAQLRPRRKWVFQEILLLLLRLLLLIALALLLANPVSMQSVSSQRWVVVVPGAEVSAANNLPLPKASEWHWLTPGFSDFENTPVVTNLSISSLLRELDAQLPANTALTIVAPEDLAGLDGERIRLSRKVDWNIVAGTAPATKASENATPIRLAIRYDKAHADSAIYFRAAHAAWQAELKTNQKQLLDAADIASSLKPDRTALIWLASGALPAEIREWVHRGGSVIVSKDALLPEIKSSAVAWRNGQGKALARVTALGNGRILQWQQALKPETMPELLDASFPEHLKTLLQITPPAPTRAFTNSQTPLTGAKAFPEAPRSLQIWFALLIAGLFLVERWLANSARRWSAA